MPPISPELSNRPQGGRLLGELVQRVHVAVFNLLVGENAHGLRDFAQRCGRFCADRGGKAAVFATVFRDQAVVAAVSGYIDVFQLGGTVGQGFGGNVCAQSQRNGENKVFFLKHIGYFHNMTNDNNCIL